MDLHMKLGDNGEAFFVEETEEEDVSVVEYFLPCTTVYKSTVCNGGSHK